MKRLVVNFARVGDMVLLSPLLRQLGRSGRIELLTRPWGRAVLGEQPWLGAIHQLAKPHRGHGFPGSLFFGAPLRELAATLRASAFDEVVVFRQESKQVRGWLESWLGSATLRELDANAPGGATRHPLDIYRAALAQGGFDVEGYDPVPRLEVSAASLAKGRARVGALGARVLSIQAGSSLTHRLFRKRPNLKGLTPAQWAGLLERIFAAGDADAAILHGSAPEGREARAIRAALPAAIGARVHDWTGDAPLEQLPGIFSAVRALISVDTGPAHMAAAVGCPSLVIFGPSDPARWQPRGPGPVEPLVGSAPCQFCVETTAFKRCRSNICLNTLPTETLFAGWRRLAARLEPVPA